MQRSSILNTIGRALRPERGQQLALGLQGGGALGAFTWGVLDGLLDGPDFRCAAVSGASAGAVNGVLLISGMMQGGPARAREVLRQFWQRSSRSAPWNGPWLDRWRERWMSPAALAVSPYQFNPFGHNPLREILSELVDFELLKRPAAPRLFVSATDVGTGKARTFSNGEISLDAVLASACLPHLFHAIEIEGRHYWDGGFTANPPVEPLTRWGRSTRLLFVILNPTAAPELPRTAPGIANRLHQIMGNAPLVRELKALGRYDKIELADYARFESAGDKLNNDWEFLQHLHRFGRTAAADWYAGRKPAAAAN